MKKNSKKYYVVCEDILPEALLKTALAKDALRRGDAQGIPEAAEEQGIARSTFYKYKDGIFSFLDLGSMDIVNISLTLEHTPGVLSAVLGEVARLKDNVLTINQSLPSHGTAFVTMSVGTRDAASPDELLEALEKLTGVVDVKILGIN